MLKQQVLAIRARLERSGRLSTTMIAVAGLGLLIAIFMAILFGVVVLMPAIQHARETARRAQAENNLRQIGLALQNYRETQNSFVGAESYEDPALDIRDDQK